MAAGLIAFVTHENLSDRMREIEARLAMDLWKPVVLVYADAPLLQTSPGFSTFAKVFGDWASHPLVTVHHCLESAREALFLTGLLYAIQRRKKVRAGRLKELIRAANTDGKPVHTTGIVEDLIYCDVECPHRHSGAGPRGASVCGLDGSVLDFYDWHIASCVDQQTDPLAEIKIDYTNWRGERTVRSIVVDRLEFGSDAWHSSQLLLRAYDPAKGADRSFAVANIHSITSAVQFSRKKAPR